MVAEPLTKMMCHASVDGGAAIVVTADQRPRSVAVASIEQTSWPHDPKLAIGRPVRRPASQVTLTAHRAFDAAQGPLQRPSALFPCTTCALARKSPR